MLLDCSNALLQAVKKKQSSETVRILNLFNTFSLQDAITELKSDADKKVFWVNVYNSYFQIMAAKNKADLQISNSIFFKRKQIDLLGLKLSFDDIEHVILRRSKWKLSLGYLNKPFSKNWEKSLRVQELDYRIHFVLNCGAISCPIIYPLTAKNVNAELEDATLAYLNQEVSVENDKIVLNKLFLFYLGDFGGRKGLKTILKQYEIIQDNEFDFKFLFTEFDKGTKLNNFVQK